MSSIVILHFQPLELYPPIQNILNFIPQKPATKDKLYVFTTATNISDLKKYVPPTNNIRIKRLGYSGSKINFIFRYWGYLYYNIASLLFLLFIRPRKIFYFETISSYPVYIYKRFLRKNVRVFIHYHEYTSPSEYQNGMRLTKFFYKREKYLYPEVSWISHTNKFRMERFLLDNNLGLFKNQFIMPNYPTKKWRNATNDILNKPIKIVYVGAVSLESMYIKEFAEWVIKQCGEIIWDIYTYNITDDARIYIQSLNTEFINLKEGIDYKELPKVLTNYSIGLILYKGISYNHTYSAPNKLFEYLIFGLDVWLPDQLIGSLSYCTKHTYPKVISIDFTRINEVDFKQLIDRSGLVKKESNFVYENIYSEVTTRLFT